MAFAKLFCELIIKVVHEQIKIPEVEYFDLELEFFLFCELFFVFDCQLLYVRSGLTCKVPCLSYPKIL